MISLIKNELVKIFHKKGIYILGGIILFIMGTGALSEVFKFGDVIEEKANEQYYTYLEESLDNYNLANSDEINPYIDTLSELNNYKVTKDYDYHSAELYYYETEIDPVYREMWVAKYSHKDENAYLELKQQYEEMIKNLDNYDWQSKVKQQKEQAEQEIEELKQALEVATSDEEKNEIEKNIERQGYILTALDYRLDNDVAPSYGPKSALVERYLSAASTYASINKDENSYKTRESLLESRRVISEYMVAKYKIENDIVQPDEYTLQTDMASFFMSTDMFILIAFLLIAGGIIAEEFNKGTIKQLLLRPFSRSKILVSKIIAALIATTLFAIFYYAAECLYVGFVYKDFTSIFDPILVYDFNLQKVVEYNTFAYCGLTLLATLPEYLMLFALCICVGIITTNTIACVVTMLGVPVVSMMLSEFLNEKIVAYLPTSCLNFNDYLFGGISSNPYQTLPMNIVIYVITFVIVVALSFIVFNKKDIKNQ